MVVKLVPYLVAVLVLAAFVFFGPRIGLDYRRYLENYAGRFKEDLTRADMATSPVDFVLGSLGGGVIVWVLLLFLLYDNPLLIAVAFPLCMGFALGGGYFYLKFRAGRRLGKFTDQLEMVLRMIAGAVRVGLTLRQGLQMVVDEVPDPARREFSRALAKTNLGIPLIDALDAMAASLPGSEMEMFTRVVRVQSKTGGDLGKVLDKLAGTIRDRRQIQRKMGALTAQGRFGAGIIGLLPVGVGGFIILTQPDMKQALLHTFPGVCVLGVALTLEGLAIFTLNKILQLDV